MKTEITTTVSEFTTSQEVHSSVAISRGKATLHLPTDGGRDVSITFCLDDLFKHLVRAANESYVCEVEA